MRLPLALICYMIWVYAIPYRWKLSRMGMVILPWAGAWAYRDGDEAKSGQQKTAEARGPGGIIGR